MDKYDPVHDAIADALRPEPDDVLASWVVVAQWAGADGSRRVQRVWSDTMTAWELEGLLHWALTRMDPPA
jgi:hypothetical protein